MTTISATQAARFHNALPFWFSLGLLAIATVAVHLGGWWLLLIPVCSWGLASLLDAFIGLNTDNLDLDCTEADLFWYRLITIIWFPLQAVLIFGTIYYVSQSALSSAEKVGIFMGIGVLSGTVGINYAHELMHQKPKLERWMADLLLASVLYSHFRSEHLLVHHRYIGTPRDPVTARYNEGFHRYYPRVLRQCFRSALKAEAAMLSRRGLPWFHSSNPFWRYAAMQLAFLGLAFLIGGWEGIALFAVQAGVAIWQLELVNYIEHYGLTRKHLGAGKYEHVKPRHSWNSSQRATNWLLINLQRHSDHHYKPDRRFPLLQHRSEEEAPQLPFGYPVMTIIAMVPPVFLRMMNPRVRAWRKKYYPEIEDWSGYKTAQSPMPR